VEVFVNYGRNYTSKDLANWLSLKDLAFLDISKDDPYFNTHKISLSNSSFTVGVFAYRNTTYSLLVSSFPNPVQRIVDKEEKTCVTRKNMDYCYFVYHNTPIEDYILDFNANFLYGNGTILANFFNSSEDIVSHLPNIEKYQYSSSDQNSRDSLTINYTAKFDRDGGFQRQSILISIFCEKPCFSKFGYLLRSSNQQLPFNYLILDRDNFINLKKNSNQTLTIFNLQPFDFTISSTLVSGSAFISVYSMENSNKLILSKFKQFALSPKNYTFVKVRDWPFYIDIEAEREEVSLIINILPQRNWTNLPVSSPIRNYWSLDNDFYGYLTLPRSFESLSINLHSKDFYAGADIYAYLVTIDNEKDLSNLQIAPSSIRSDWKGSIDLELKTVIVLG
jgi:hypothetical protein